MSTPAVSSARKLLAAIDELMALVTNYYPRPTDVSRRLKSEESKHLFAVDGRIAGLLVVLGLDSSHQQQWPTKSSDSSSYTRGTRLRYNMAQGAVYVSRSTEWEVWMVSLRAAAQAIVETEGASGQTDRKPDTRKKTNNRVPKNFTTLLALKKAIARGAKWGQTQSESAVEFTNGDEKKAETLLRHLRRHRSHPGLQ